MSSEEERITRLEQELKQHKGNRTGATSKLPHSNMHISSPYIISAQEDNRNFDPGISDDVEFRQFVATLAKDLKTLGLIEGVVIPNEFEITEDDMLLKTAVFEWDYAAGDSGAIGIQTLRQIGGGPIPDNAVLLTTNMTLDVITIMADGGTNTATVNLGIETTSDIFNSAFTVDNYVVGIYNPSVSGVNIKTTLDGRGIKFTIITHALTGGHFLLFIVYFVSE